MKKITAIIIAKNEETMIEDCIDSVLFCDEILVIDGGSQDRTVEIAQKMGAKVYHHPFTDFSSARNFGLEKAKGDWLFYIDADERAGNEFITNLEQIKNENNTPAAYKVQRKNFYFGRHAWPHIEKMERIFKKENLKGWYGVLHETPKIEGEVSLMDGFLLHYTHRELFSMVEKTLIWSTEEAQLRYDSHHPEMNWWRFPRVMIPTFLHSFIKQKGYKVGVVGLIESIYQSFSIFITYAKLWELQNDKK